MGEQLVPNVDGDLYTQEKKEARWAFIFIFILTPSHHPSSHSGFSFCEHSSGLNLTMHYSLYGVIWNLGVLREYISAQTV